MRKLSYILAVPVLLFVAFIAYGLLFPWYPHVKRQSVQVLAAAKTTNELRKAVGTLGLFIPLTNGAWIAIRYRDSHGGGISSCAVARDSGGGWFESDRHFCGSLPGWPTLKESAEMDEELRRTNPELFTNKSAGRLVDADNGMFPSYRDMNAIASAPNLESARSALRKIGFKDMQ